MPRYYFRIRDRLGLTDDPHGIELNSAAEAYDYTLDSIRSIVADDARRGVLSLGGCIEISDDLGLVVRVPYADAFALPAEALRGPADADNDNAGSAPGLGQFRAIG